MNYNIFLIRFNLNPNDFVDKEPVIIETNNTIIYEIIQKVDEKICPVCKSKCCVKDHDWVEIKVNSTIGKTEILRIYKTRLICSNCNQSFTPKLTGLDKYSKVSLATKNAIINEFYEIQSFSSIAKRYSVSVTSVVSIFDEHFKFVPRRKMPKYLCIDEKHFNTEDGSYIVIISDFFTGEIIDVLKNRKMPYLDDYFSKIPQKERENVKVFVSDMYDGYYNCYKKYFSKATFVVDLFHVIKLLTTTVNQLRIRTYKQHIYGDCIERHFLKTQWKVFLSSYDKLAYKPYHSKKFNLDATYGDLILACLKKHFPFWDGYTVLQELLNYSSYESFTESLNFINRIINKLLLSGDELLEKVAHSYKKWVVGITNGIAKNQTGRRFSNAIAENNNSHIQRIINVSYGYHNFDRLRKKILIIRTYKKGYND